ncbi:MAG: hypothetical protein IPJ94_31290 [Chloroflexi bacterium]|nr:hypothetical protein [Chloroflexota bacterium]
MSETISQRVQRDVALIDHLLAAYADLLLQVEQKPPDLVQVTALASVLHSFYNGVESIFIIIAKEIDGAVPTGDRWHRDLLEQMGMANEFREAVLPLPIQLQLQNYLAFRHYYRHAYSFFCAGKNYGAGAAVNGRLGPNKNRIESVCRPAVRWKNECGGNGRSAHVHQV